MGKEGKVWEICTSYAEFTVSIISCFVVQPPEHVVNMAEDGVNNREIPKYFDLIGCF